jgi:FtsP/CotA-like multicopper oxidase with cupredoxin domain
MPNLAGAAATVSQIPTGPRDINGNWATPDYYTTANWANSPPLAKFVDTLPGLTGGKANSTGQYLAVGKPDITTYPGSDYYEIELIEYRQQMHPDLPKTTGPTSGATTGTLLRGYVQVNNGTDTSTCGGALPQLACTTANNTLLPDPVRYLGPTIVAQRDRPVRIKFTNRLPSGKAGDLFIPVDVSVMGAGAGPANPVVARGEVGTPCDSTVEPNTCAMYTQNRAAIHLHGGRTPWISDGTPHQWITPVEEITPFTKGVSLKNVPDMPDPGDGSTTYYYTNQQSARLMFYHEHAWGITRLNPYVGVAAGYLITDQWEQDLINRGILPPFLDQIPLVIQDKTFVDDTPVTHPVTGEATTKIRLTDPLWNWGSAAPDANGIRPPVKGDLWMPHVYLPAQSQVRGAGGTNPFGRWMYGPWFYPATIVSKGPIPNPYFDQNCSSANEFELAECQTPGQNTLIPGTPNVSMGMEAFQDSAVVNGAVFPSLTVDPRAYRFRILNAANDRFWNLSFYKADPNQVSPDPRLNPLSPSYISGRSNKTEVKTVPASAQLAADNNWPPLWPVDGRDGGVPDPGTCTGSGATLSCPNFGPSFLQIGTESGFLPKPVEVKQQPITYNIDPTAFWVGNVNKMALALGPAERADVIVDFSNFAGQTLILYNDAPAAWPAGVITYDYYTGAPDLREIGGFGTGGEFDSSTRTWVNGTGPKVGYAPNIRTVMQIVVRQAGSRVDGPYSFSQANLEREFTAAAPVTAVNPAPAKTLFERSQEPIIVGQPAYSTAYPNSFFPFGFPWEGIAQINDQALSFITLAGQKVKVTTEPKGLHDEMGASFDPVYGRMSGNLGMQLPNPTTLNALLVLYGFSDLPTEFVNNSNDVNVQVLPGLPGQPGTVTDGTQIWKINHNGVDTHPIHFHIFDVQLINRVGWDGQILLPEPNELGWKETVKISPLEDTIVAVRPRAPLLPFGIPNSLRPLNPAIPIDSGMGFGTPIPTGSDWPILGSATGFGFSSIDWQTGNAYAGTPVPPFPYPNYKGVVTNIMYNFGWEYVWHCHILSHEEMDMMRPIVLNYDAMLPPAFTATATPNASDVVLNWNDPTPVDYAKLTSFGNPANEIGFNVYRTTAGSFTLDLAGNPVPQNPTTLLANTTSYTDTGLSGVGETYIVEAFNAKGSTVSIVGSLFTAAVATTNGPTFTSPGPVNLAATISGVPTGLTVTQVAFYDGATLIGAAIPAPGPYTVVWNNVSVGTHSITARVSTNFPAVVVISPAIDVIVGGTLTADFTPNGATVNVCDIIPFVSTSTGTISGYSWLIGGTTYTTPTVDRRLPPGSQPVTLAVRTATSETAQVTKIFTVISHLPTANTGGPYNVLPGDILQLNGTGTNPQDPCSTMTAFGWDINNKAGYEFSTANPTISYNALLNVLGVGTHPMTFMVTDSNGGVATAATTVTIAAPDIRMHIGTNVNYSFFPNLQTAYTAAGNNAVIDLTSVAVPGGLVANRNITVTLSGGLDTGFAAVTGVTAIRNTVTIKQGKVVMRNVRIIDPHPAITTSSPLPNYTIGSGLYSTTITAAGGVATYSYAVTAGTPPAELTLTPAGLLSGTPTTPGTYNFTITVTDSASPPLSSSKAFTLTVIQSSALAITTPSQLTGYTIGTGLYSATIAATGGIAPISFSVTAGAMPVELSLSAAGLITGTPATPGTYDFTVTATDVTQPTNATTSKAFQLVVTQPAALAITTPSQLTGYTIGTGAYSASIAATGGIAPVSFTRTAGALPVGLSLSAAGQLTGTPTTAGTYDFTVTATDVTQPTAVTASKAFQLVVTPAPAITTASSLPGYLIGTGAYSATIAATGGIAPISFSVTAGAMPVELTLAANGQISGTPATAGTYNFTVTATDMSQPTNAVTSKAFQLIVTQPATLAITTASQLTGYTIGTGPYSATIAATGGIAPVSFTVTGGAMPVELSLSAAGLITGTPATAGTYDFTVTATDVTQPTAATTSKAFQLVVTQPAALSITTASQLTGYTIGTGAYSATIAATGGIAPISFTVTGGAMPVELSLSAAGLITGTPATPGTYDFTVTATDVTQPINSTTSKAFQLIVADSLAFTTTSPLPSYSIASGPINLQFAASGGTPGYTFSSAGFVALGFTFNSNGQMTGTPPLSSVGLWNIVVRVTDSAVPTVFTNKSFSLNITP